jgi:hypothetical protein
MRKDRQHWGIVTPESEALQVLNKDSAREFGLYLFFDGSWLGALLAMSHHKCDGPTEEFTETECSPYDSICGERFPDRFVSKKNSLITDAPQEYSFTGEYWSDPGSFSEIAPLCLVKAPPGKITPPGKMIPLGILK